MSSSFPNWHRWIARPHQIISWINRYHCPHISETLGRMVSRQRTQKSSLCQQATRIIDSELLEPLRGHVLSSEVPQNASCISPHRLNMRLGECNAPRVFSSLPLACRQRHKHTVCYIACSGGRRDEVEAILHQIDFSGRSGLPKPIESRAGKRELPEF
jgi:hypothetical protein